MSAAVMNAGASVFDFGDFHYKSHGMSSGSSASSAASTSSSSSSSSGGVPGKGGPSPPPSSASSSTCSSPTNVACPVVLCGKGGVFRRSSNPLSADGPAPGHRKLDRSQSEPAAPASAAVNTSRYKTELCRPFEESGSCKYGDKCQFAHGARELRSLARHPKYKTELCRTFHTIGFCPYGPRCHFIHNADEARAKVVVPGSPPPLVAAASPAPSTPSTATSPVADVFAFSFPSPLVMPTPPPSPPSPAASLQACFPSVPHANSTAPTDARLPVFKRVAAMSEVLAGGQ